MTEVNSCKKAPFSTKQLALDRLAEIRTHGDKRYMIPIRAYRCEHCGLFHLTSKTHKQFVKNVRRGLIEVEVRQQRTVDSVVAFFANRKGWRKEDLKISKKKHK